MNRVSNNLWQGGIGDFGLGSNWSTGHKKGNDEIDVGDATISASETIINVDSLLLGTAGNLTVDGTLENAPIVNHGTIFDNGNISAPTATFTNTGLIQIGAAPSLTSSGLMAGSSGALRVAAIVNTGEIELEGLSQGATPSAIVKVFGAAGFGTAGVISGDISLSGSSVIKFASGSFTSIAAGAALSLNGADAVITTVGAAYANTTLATLATNSGTLDLKGGASITTSGALSNFGTIDLEKGVAGSDSSLTVGGALTNHVDEQIILGGDKKLAGFDSLTISGALDNFGSLSLGSKTLANAVTVTAASLENGQSGSIDLQTATPTSSTATLDINSAAGFGAAGVVTGNVYIEGNSTLEFASGQISTIAEDAGLEISGANAFLADASALNSNSALNLSLVTGYFELDNGASETSTGALTVKGELDLDYSDPIGSVVGGSSLTVDGALTNDGGIYIGEDTALIGNDTVTVASLVNNGTLDIEGSSATGGGEALVNDNSAAGLGVAGAISGTVYLEGNSTLEFASGQISNIVSGADLELYGADAFVADSATLGSNSALNLTQVQGTLELDDGASVTSTGALTVTGQVWVDNYNNAKGGSSLTVDGALTNDGYIGVGGEYLAANVTVTVASLVNNSALYLGGEQGAGEALFDDKSAAGTLVGGVLTGEIGLQGNATLEFASGAIVAIDGSLQLDGADAFVADASALGSNSALDIGLVVGGFALDNGASETTSGTLTIASGSLLSIDYTSLFFDYESAFEGGSSLTVGGALINYGNIEIGNTNITANDTVTVAVLVNADQLSIVGNKMAGAGEALVDDTSVAGLGTLGAITGSVYLSGDATLEFASGQIDTLDGYLQLVGSDAFVADASALGSNSALNISEVFGGLELDNGASETSTGDLTVYFNGYLDLDYSSTNGGSSLTVDGVLTNMGYVSVGNQGIGAEDTLTAASLVNSGTLWIQGEVGAGEALLDVKSVAGMGTAAEITGEVNVIGNATLEFASGQFTSVDDNAELYLFGADAFVADATALASNSALNIATVGGTFDLEAGASETTTGAMTVNGWLYVDANSPIGGSSLSVGGALINDDVIEIGSVNLLSSDKVSVASLVNNGDLDLTGFPGVGEAVLTVNSAAGFGGAGVAAGTVTGNVDLVGNASIEFASGQITTIAAGANLELYGAHAVITEGTTLGSNSGLNLSQVSGGLQIEDGASVSSSGALTVSGVLFVDDLSAAGGSSVTVGGALTNTGWISIGNTNLLANDNVTVASIINSGELDLDGGAGAGEALLNVKSAAGFGTTGTVSGRVSLDGDATLEFASGGISTIAGGSGLYLSGPDAFLADASDLGSESALTGLATVNGVFELSDGASLTTTSALTVGGELYIDYFFDTQGGSSLTVGGALTNNDFVSVGGYDITANDTLTVTSLANNGTLDVIGNQGYAEALITVGGAAGFGTAGTVTGDISLYEEAEIDFASGSLATIAAGATLDLIGAGAEINDTGGGANSALAGLTANNGILALADGSSVPLSGPAFTNNGTIYIDSQNFGGGYGGSTLTVTGTLTNATDIYIGSSFETADDILAATTLVNSHYIESDGNSMYGAIINGAITNTGTIDDNIGNLTISGAVSGVGGNLYLGNYNYATTLDLAGAISSQFVDFLHSSFEHQTLVLGDVAGFASTSVIADFNSAAVGAEEIDVKGFVATSFNVAADVLTLTNAAATTESLHFTGAVYTNASFAITETATDTIIKNAV